VFEETESGGEWKLFREFTPSQPMTAREAASKRVGDTVNLDGTPTRVTLVDQSRVYQIEGQAPEGVEVGDVANYFNVDTGNRMLVASWTGDEIEFYEGLDAPTDGVAETFGFPRDATSNTVRFSGDATRGFATGTSATGSNTAAGSSTSSGMFTKLVFVLVTAASLFGAYSCYSNRRSSRVSSSAPPPKQAAPAFKLPNGAHGSLGQHNYTIDSQAVVEVARVSGRFERREYEVRDETTQGALLINGLSGGSKEWHLLNRVTSPPDLTPYDAATKRRNAPVNVDGHTLQVTDLFQSKALSAEGPESNTALPGVVQYGFVARQAGDWLIARWTENQIQFFRGAAVQDAEVLASLGRAPDKTK